MPKNSLIAAVMALALATPLAASLILYEGFDYSSSNILGQSGGTGFAGPWTESAGAALDIKPGLSYAGFLPSVGNAGSLIVGANRSGARLIQDASTYTSAGQAQWFSLLGQFPNLGGVGGQAYVTFFGAGDYQGVGLRVLQDGNGPMIAPNIDGSIGSVTALTGIPITFGETQLLLGKIVWNTDTNVTVSLWSNPVPTGVELDLGTPHVQATGNTTVGSRLWIRGNSASDGIFDEVRLGTTLEAVMVPEPGIYAWWLGLGVLAVAFLARRRRA